MSKVTIYHNPRCSKSRQTLELLEDRGCQVTVIEYLRDPPSPETLQELARGLPGPTSEMIRAKEWREIGLAEPSSDAEIFAQLAENPRALQRPIVVCGGAARIGRPPESVLEIL